MHFGVPLCLVRPVVCTLSGLGVNLQQSPVFELDSVAFCIMIDHVLLNELILQPWCDSCWDSVNVATNAAQSPPVSNRLWRQTAVVRNIFNGLIQHAQGAQ